MKIFIIFSLILLNTSLIAQTHHVPSYAEEQGPDIPTVGSSMFDKIFSKTNNKGISVYSLPSPIGELMKKMVSGEGINVVHSMLPFSRSLQRPSSTSYHPLLNPRLVFSSKQSDSSIERAKIFIGFVKATNQLEVISYNDEAGRFEYQLVKDYGTKPKVFYVNRGKCLSCHQGQAPIFSVPGWSDTNTGVLGSLMAAKLGMKHNRTSREREIMAKKLFGDIPSLDAVGNFDALVRESNEISLDERIWNVGCNKSNECRLGLLLSALSGHSESAKKYLKIAGKVIMSSVLPKQNLYSSMLPPTDLGAIKVIKKYASSGPGTPYQNTANNDDALLEIISNIYKLTGSQNPANRRLKRFSNDKLVKKNLAGFTFNDRRILEEEVQDIEKVLLSLFKEKSVIFEQKSINKLLIMSTILNKENSNKAHIYQNVLNKKTPKKELFNGLTIPVFKKPVLNVFARYCHQCHASGLPFPPQFLLGSEDEVESKIKTLSTKIHFKLTNNLMPPNEKEREALINSGDIEQLLNYIKLISN